MFAQLKLVLASLALAALVAVAPGAGAQTYKAPPELRFKVAPEVRLKRQLEIVSPAPGVAPCPTCVTPNVAAAGTKGVAGLDRFMTGRCPIECMLSGTIAGIPDAVTRPYSLPGYSTGSGDGPIGCPPAVEGPDLTGAVTAVDEIGLFNDSATQWKFDFSNGTDVTTEVLAPHAIRILKVVPNRIYSMSTSNLQFTTLVPGNIYRIYVRDLAWKIE